MDVFGLFVGCLIANRPFSSNAWIIGFARGGW